MRTSVLVLIAHLGAPGAAALGVPGCGAGSARDLTSNLPAASTTRPIDQLFQIQRASGKDLPGVVTFAGRLNTGPWTIEVLDEGRGEKTPLRFSLRVGSERPVEFVVQQRREFRMRTPGQATSRVMNRTVLPELRLGFSITVVGPGIADTMLLRHEARTVAVRETPEQTTPNDALPAPGFLIGTAIGTSISTRGLIQETTLEMPSHTDATALALLPLSVAPPVLTPRDPIGIGARWSARGTSEVLGTVLIEYRLKRRTAHHAEIAGTVVTRGESQIDPTQSGGPAMLTSTVAFGLVYDLEAGIATGKTTTSNLYTSDVEGTRREVEQSLSVDAEMPMRLEPDD